MLNRHTIVLFLGLAAAGLLRGFPPDATGPLAPAFLSLVGGLLLDPGRPGFRARAAHVLSAASVAFLLQGAAAALRAGAAHIALAEAGMALAVAGLLVEMVASYGGARVGAAMQAAGDAAYLGALGLALAAKAQHPSAAGWVFIALSGGLGAYAAGANLALQLARVKSPQAGWRFRVVSEGPEGLRFATARGELLLRWRWVEAVRRVDDRHLLFVLPSPLPKELSDEALPLQELRTEALPAPSGDARPPDRYALVLHEQELGRPLPAAEALLRAHTAEARP